MALTLVDASAWIHALRPGGVSPTVRRVRALLEAGDAAWCAMTRLELWNGARGDRERKVLHEMERTLIDLEINAEVWRSANALAAASRERGKTVPAPDVLVYACARHHGVELEHADRHFEALDELTKLSK